MSLSTLSPPCAGVVFIIVFIIRGKNAMLPADSAVYYEAPNYEDRDVTD